MAEQNEETVIFMADESEENKELERQLREKYKKVEYRPSTYSEPMARVGDAVFKGYRDIQLAFLF